MNKKQDVSDDTREDILEYFHQWRGRGAKSENLYVRLRPEDKETILAACKVAELSITDFVVNSALEFSDCAIKKYHSTFPSSADCSQNETGRKMMERHQKK